MLTARRRAGSIVSGLATAVVVGQVCYATSEPVTPAPKPARGVLAAGLDQPHSLVADRTHLYWIESSSDTERNEHAGFKIVRMPRRGGPQGVLLYDWNVAVLALHGGWLYHNYQGECHRDQPGRLLCPPHQIRRLPVSGGPAEIVVADAGDFQPPLVVSAGQLCWSQKMDPGTRLACAPLSGGPVSVVRTLPEVYDFVLDGTRVYFNNRQGVWVSEETESPRSIARGDLSYLTRDRTHLYWSVEGSIWRAPLGGGTPRRVARWRHPQFRAPFALHAGDVYWVDDGRMFRAPKRGRGAVPLGRPDYLVDPGELIVDRWGAFWLWEGKPEQCGDCQCPTNTGDLVRVR